MINPVNNGYYWIEYDTTLTPEIAQYSAGNRRWYLIGSDWINHDNDVRIISHVSRPRRAR
jgi:hypothetical protein